MAPNDPAQNQQADHVKQGKALASRVKQLRGHVGRDERLATELADTLNELTANRLMAGQFAESTDDAQQAVVAAAKLLNEAGPVGAYTPPPVAARYFTAVTHVAVAQSGLGLLDQAGATMGTLDDFRAQLTRPLAQALLPRTAVWALAVQGRACLSRGDIAGANAWADAALTRIARTDLRSDLAQTPVVLDAERFAADARWAAGRPEESLDRLRAASDQHHAWAADALAQPARLSPAMLRLYIDQFVALRREFADRLASLGRHDEAQQVRADLGGLLAHVGGRLGADGKTLRASVAADAGQDAGPVPARVDGWAPIWGEATLAPEMEDPEGKLAQPGADIETLAAQRAAARAEADRVAREKAEAERAEAERVAAERAARLAERQREDEERRAREEREEHERLVREQREAAERRARDEELARERERLQAEQAAHDAAERARLDAENEDLADELHENEDAEALAAHQAAHDAVGEVERVRAEQAAAEPAPDEEQGAVDRDEAVSDQVADAVTADSAPDEALAGDELGGGAASDSVAGDLLAGAEQLQASADGDIATGSDLDTSNNELATGGEPDPAEVAAADGRGAEGEGFEEKVREDAETFQPAQPTMGATAFRPTNLPETTSASESTPVPEPTTVPEPAHVVPEPTPAQVTEAPTEPAEPLVDPRVTAWQAAAARLSEARAAGGRRQVRDAASEVVDALRPLAASDPAAWNRRLGEALEELAGARRGVADLWGARQASREAKDLLG